MAPDDALRAEAEAWAKAKWPSTISTEDDRRRHAGAIGYFAGHEASTKESVPLAILREHGFHCRECRDKYPKPWPLEDWLAHLQESPT